MAISREEITEIRNAVNIVDFIGQFVALKKTGQNFQGLCPFHNEKTPSFSVNPSKGIFKCFGCGKGGSVFDFAMEYRKVGFQAAVQEVADFAGIKIQLNQREIVAENPNAKLYEINNQASYVYENYLLITEQGNEARHYLENRGLDENTIKYFDLGLSADLPNFLYQSLSNKFEDEILAKSGLFNYSNHQVYDTFQNRLMFTIHDQNGQTIGFSGRIWQKSDERPGKYVNTTTTPIFEKSDVLYNLHRAKEAIRKSKEVYLMEGFMDVIAAYQSGISNVAAIMGTALTEKHVKQLTRLAKKVILVTDGDEAGQAAIEKSLKQIQGLEVQIVRIPEAMDPDEYVRSHDSEALLNLLKNFRISSSEFLMDYLRPANLENVVNQLEYLQKIAPSIAAEKNPDIQQVYMRRLVEILPDFEYNQIEQVIKNADQARRRKSEPQISEIYPSQRNLPFEQSSSVNVEETSVFIQRNVSRSEKLERQILYAMLLEPHLIEKLSLDSSLKFRNSNTESLYNALIIEEMTSGTIDSTFFPESLDQDLRRLYYDVLEMDLPESITDDELGQLLKELRKENQREQIKRLQLEGQKAKSQGNQAKELEIAMQIIELRKQLQRGQV